MRRTAHVLLIVLLTAFSPSIFAAETPARPASAIIPVTTATLNGFVRDSETKETIISATVVVKGTKIGALTNKNGYYSLKSIPAGKQTIVISYLGYKKMEKVIDFEEGDSKKLDIVLTPQSVQTQQVVVDAERHQPQPHAAPPIPLDRKPRGRRRRGLVATRRRPRHAHRRVRPAGPGRGGPPRGGRPLRHAGPARGLVRVRLVRGPLLEPSTPGTPAPAINPVPV